MDGEGGVSGVKLWEGWLGRESWESGFENSRIVAREKRESSANGSLRLRIVEVTRARVSKVASAEQTTVCYFAKELEDEVGSNHSSFVGARSQKPATCAVHAHMPL
jgi:hypothetical protein